MTRDEFFEFCRDRIEAQSLARRRKRIDSVRPHDPLLAQRLARELELEEVTADQARAALARTG